MFSIGILGFIVWSFLVGPFNSNIKLFYFAICQDIILEYSTIFYYFSNNLYFICELTDNIHLDHQMELVSEIVREDSLYFSTLSVVGFKLSSIDNQWIKWFIGFVEGDGSIITDKDNRLRFVITQNELAILDHIQSILGFGEVYYDKGVNSWRYRVEKLDHISELAILFNGNLYLDHRIEQLARWTDVLIHKGYNIDLISNKISISLNDAWLSGFTDAEGCFNVNIYTRSSMSIGFRVVLRFLLDQNDQNSLLAIQSLFGFGYVNKRGISSKSYRYTADAFTKLDKLENYYRNFPLKTIKKDAFLKWVFVRSLMLKKEHLNREGFNSIRKLAKEINNKSTIRNYKE